MLSHRQDMDKFIKLITKVDIPLDKTIKYIFNLRGRYIKNITTKFDRNPPYSVIVTMISDIYPNNSTLESLSDKLSLIYSTRIPYFYLHEVSPTSDIDLFKSIYELGIFPIPNTEQNYFMYLNSDILALIDNVLVELEAIQGYDKDNPFPSLESYKKYIHSSKISEERYQLASLSADQKLLNVQIDASIYYGYKFTGQLKDDIIKLADIDLMRKSRLITANDIVSYLVYKSNDHYNIYNSLINDVYIEFLWEDIRKRDIRYLLHDQHLSLFDLSYHISDPHGYD